MQWNRCIKDSLGQSTKSRGFGNNNVTFFLDGQILRPNILSFISHGVLYWRLLYNRVAFYVTTQDSRLINMTCTLIIIFEAIAIPFLICFQSKVTGIVLVL